MLREALRRPGKSITGGVGVISARRAVVIAWRYDCCADGGGAEPHTNAAVPVASTIAAVIPAAAIASICQGISRDTRDAKDSRRGN